MDLDTFYHPPGYFRPIWGRFIDTFFKVENTLKSFDTNRKAGEELSGEKIEEKAFWIFLKNQYTFKSNYIDRLNIKKSIEL